MANHSRAAPFGYRTLEIMSVTLNSNGVQTGRSGCAFLVARVPYFLSLQGLQDIRYTSCFRMAASQSFGNVMTLSALRKG